MSAGMFVFYLLGNVPYLNLSINGCFRFAHKNVQGEMLYGFFSFSNVKKNDEIQSKTPTRFLIS